MKHDEFAPHEVEWDAQRSARFWNFHSSSGAHEQRYFGRQNGLEVANLLKRKVLRNAQTILDYSCGKGDVLLACAQLLREEQRFHGADISRGSLDAAELRLKSFPNFSGTTLLEKIPSALPDGYFDLVIVTEVLEHIAPDQLGAVLGEINRVTSQGGKVFITTPYQEDLQRDKTICPDCGCIFHRWQHMTSWSIDEVADKLGEFGFSKRTCQNIQWGPWLLKLYFKVTGRKGNGIYYLGEKVAKA